MNIGGSGGFATMTQTPPADSPTILVTDDNEILRLNACELLESHGFTVVQADNAEEALNVLETRKDVRLLFTDIQMPPGLDGLALAREVHQRWPKILLVITSGQISPARADIADHGRFLQKPYRSADLLGQIDEMIDTDNKKIDPQN